MPFHPFSQACFADKESLWTSLSAEEPALRADSMYGANQLKDEFDSVTSFDHVFARESASLSFHTSFSEYQSPIHESEDFSRCFTASSEGITKQGVQKNPSASENLGRRESTSDSENLVALLESGICAGLGTGGRSTFLEKITLHQLPQGPQFEHPSTLRKPETSLSSLLPSATPSQALSHLPDMSHSDALALSMALGLTPDSTATTGRYLEAAIKWHFATHESLQEHCAASQHPGDATSLVHVNGNASMPSSERFGLGSVECTTPEQVSRVLNILGSTSRSKADPFIDAAALVDPGVPRMARGGVCELFPDKLYRMIRDMEEEGKAHVIGFLPHGRAFKVHKMDVFLKDVLPRYFSDQSKWSSFSRQLNLYGFLRATSDRDGGAYYHELFLQGRPNLVAYMRRVGAPKGLQDRRRFKVPDGDDPDFWALPPFLPDLE